MVWPNVPGTLSFSASILDKMEETFSRLRMTSVFLFLSDPSVNFCLDNSTKAHHGSSRGHEGHL